MVDRSGQKPCCSLEYRCGMCLLSRNVNSRVRIRYHTEETDIGLNFEASLVAWSALGIAVNKVINRGVSTRPYTRPHKNDYINGANTSDCKSNFIASTSIPKAPTAALLDIPATVACNSAISNSAFRLSRASYCKVTKSPRKSSVIEVGTEGLLKNCLKWAVTYDCDASTTVPERPWDTKS